MGVNGLFTLVKKYSKKQKISDAIEGRKLGIDIFWFIHKSKGNPDVIKEMLSEYIDKCEKGVFVFDGKVSEERKPELSALKEKRATTLKLIKKLEDDANKLDDDANLAEKHKLKEYIEKLRIQSWAPKGNYVEKVKEKIRDWWPDKNRIIVAPYEADLYFGELLNNKMIDCIISNDSDMLALGYNNVVRPLDERGFAQTYNLQTILNGFKMNKKDWFHFIEICRRYNGADILVPYSYWRVYRNYPH